MKSFRLVRLGVSLSVSKRVLTVALLFASLITFEIASGPSVVNAADGVWSSISRISGAELWVNSVSCSSDDYCAAVASGGFSIPQVGVVFKSPLGWGALTSVPGLNEANTGNNAWVSSISCASDGDCTLGGMFREGTAYHAFVASSVDGVMGAYTEIPGLRFANSGNRSSVSTVSCTSSGNCVATGNYSDSLDHAFLAVQSNGVWSNYSNIPGMSSTATSAFEGKESVSCSTAGNCTAAGMYYEDGLQQAFVVSLVDGVWGNYQDIPNLKTVNVWGARATAVSCSSLGNCTVGGQYIDATRNYQPYAANQTSGTWSNFQAIPGLTAGSQVQSLSCSSPGNCTIGGMGGGTSGGFAATQTNGVWGNLTEMGANIGQVSCSSPGNCTIGGSYKTGTRYDGFVSTQTNGIWGGVTDVPGLVNANTGRSAAVLTVSCSTAGNCSVGGYLRAGTVTSSYVATQNVPPENTELPVVTGIARTGETLTTTNGSWTKSPTSYTYQWKRSSTIDGYYEVIPNIDRNWYVLTDSEIGKYIKVSVVSSNINGPSAAVDSVATSVVADLPDSEVPTATTPVATTTGFSFKISNYSASYTYMLTSTIGSATRLTDDVTVTGLGSGESATVTIAVTRSGYKPGSKDVLGSALPRPSGETGVSINRGTSYTNSRDVSLRIVWPSGASTVRISNDGGFAADTTSVFSLNEFQDWKLDASTPGLNTKIVYVRFGGSGFNTSLSYSDDILLDVDVPVIASATAEQVGAYIVLTLAATDGESGLSKIEVNNGSKTVDVDFAASVLVKASDIGLGASASSLRKMALGSLKIRVSDKAGNKSSWTSLGTTAAPVVTTTVAPVVTTTVAPVVTTTVAPVVTTTAVPVNAPTVAPLLVPALTSPKLTASKSASAKSIATFAKLKVLSTSKVGMKVVASSAKFCRVSGTTLKGLKAGSCKVTVTVTPKKGKAISKTVTMKVTK
jgi:hypothetical protein